MIWAWCCNIILDVLGVLQPKNSVESLTPCIHSAPASREDLLHRMMERLITYCSRWRQSFSIYLYVEELYVIIMYTLAAFSGGRACGRFFPEDIDI